MYIYVQTGGAKLNIIYIPKNSGNSTPYDGPLWIAVLLLGSLYIILLYLWYNLYVDLIMGTTGKGDKIVFSIFTLLILSTGFVATMAFI